MCVDDKLPIFHILPEWKYLTDSFPTWYFQAGHIDIEFLYFVYGKQTE